MWRIGVNRLSSKRVRRSRPRASALSAARGRKKSEAEGDEEELGVGERESQQPVLVQPYPSNFLSPFWSSLWSWRPRIRYSAWPAGCEAISTQSSSWGDGTGGAGRLLRAGTGVRRKALGPGESVGKRLRREREHVFCFAHGPPRPGERACKVERPFCARREETSSWRLFHRPEALETDIGSGWVPCRDGRVKVVENELFARRHCFHRVRGTN